MIQSTLLMYFRTTVEAFQVLGLAGRRAVDMSRMRVWGVERQWYLRLMQTGMKGRMGCVLISR